MKLQQTNVSLAIAILERSFFFFLFFVKEGYNEEDEALSPLSLQPKRPWSLDKGRRRKPCWGSIHIQPMFVIHLQRK